MFARTSSLLRFGPFTVDRAGHCLLRDGVRVPIQEQPYQILLALLETPGQLVTRESLRLRLWGEETFVDFDQSLNSAVRRLRVALGDSSRQPVYVATVPRVGFRFLAEVREGSPAAEMAVPDEAAEAKLQLTPTTPVRARGSEWEVRWWLVLLAAVGLLGGVLAGAGRARVWLRAGRTGAAVEAKSSAVGSLPEWAASLPFADSAERSAATPGNGMAEPSLSAMRTPDAADYGQVSLSGAGSLLRAAKPGSRAGQPETLGTARLTELTGWYHLQLRTEVDYGLAKRAFEQAIAEEPQSPTPLVGLGESEILMALNGYRPAERLRAARLAGERALRLAPDLPEAHAVIGAVDALERWDLTETEREFDVALRLDPHSGLARLWLAVFVLLPQHRYAEAEQQTRMAIQDAPLSLAAHTDLGWIYASQGRGAAARAEYDFVLGINPEFVPARFHMSQLLRAEGRMEEARRMLPRDPPGFGDPLPGSGGRAGDGAGLVSVEAAQVPEGQCERITGDWTGGRADGMAVIRAAVQGRCSNFFFFGLSPEFNHLRANPEFAGLERTAFVSRR